MMSTQAPEVSIVVPTRNRPQSLRRCLEAVTRQQSLGSLEIIVVDDGSERGEVVAEVVGATRNAHLVRLHGAGPAAARNAGIRCARAEMVCLLDDDCEPHPEWAARLAEALRSGADAAAGATINGLPANPFAEASQIIADAFNEWSARNPARLSFAATNNLGCRTSILREVPFDESYRHPGGEDRDWCARFTAAGHSLVARPDAVVVHHAALTFPRFVKQHIRYGLGAQRFRDTHRRFDPTRISFYAGLLRRGFRRDARLGALVCVGQLATLTGYLASVFRKAPAKPPGSPSTEARTGTSGAGGG